MPSQNLAPRPQAEVTLRAMRAADIDAVLAVQSQCYRAELIESRDALASRQRLSPDTCFVAEVDGRVRGYLFAHPWQGETPPALDTPLPALPEHCDTLFLHDMAISERLRGRGVAPRLMEKALRSARARGYRYARLVAVQGAASYWRKLGFKPYPLGRGKLACYGDGAEGMLAPLMH